MSTAPEKPPPVPRPVGAIPRGNRVLTSVSQCHHRQSMPSLDFSEWTCQHMRFEPDFSHSALCLWDSSVWSHTAWFTVPPLCGVLLCVPVKVHLPKLLLTGIWAVSISHPVSNTPYHSGLLGSHALSSAGRVHRSETSQVLRSFVHLFSSIS